MPGKKEFYQEAIFINTKQLGNLYMHLVYTVLF